METLFSLLGHDWLIFLIDNSVKTTILLVLTLLLVWRLTRASASVRHFVLSCALLGAMALPIVSSVLPRWEVAPVPGVTFLDQRIVDTTPVAAATDTPRAIRNQNENELRAPSHPAGIHWSRWLLLAWLVGASLVGARLFAGLAWTRWLRRTASAIPPTDRRLPHLASSCARKIGVNGNVRLLRNARAAVPVISGWLRPAIILPAPAVRWSDDRINAVLLHEMAHVKRRDVLFGTLAHVVSVVYWFNPLVWMALRRLYTERERACDDAVLSAGTRDLDYAQHLLEISRSLSGATWFAPLEVALARKLELEGRLMDILNTKTNRTVLSAGKMLLVGLLAALFIIPIASISGRADEVQLDNVTPAEKADIMTTLTGFYRALRNGDDYDLVRERFLTEDYFDAYDLTLEKLDRRVWRPVFDNTLSLVRERHAYGNLAARPVVTSIQRSDGEYVVTQTTDIVSRGYEVKEVIEDEEGVTMIPKRDEVTGEPIPKEHGLVNGLQHRIALRKEEGRFKIARYDDGVSVMQMDTDNPYGPIFLIWIDDLGSRVTPYGPFIAKIFPAEYRTGPSTNITFELGMGE
jgi:beta-lactamase regulating signal transducer with metallopeptidase domain